MAAYFWVGGTGTWDNTTTTNWATSSGGAGGFGPPTSADSATFDANSGTGTCTTASTATCDTPTLNTANILLVCGANFSITSRFILTLGSFNLNNFTLTTQFFLSNNSNVRSIAFGTGQITLTGGNTGGVLLDMQTATNFSYTGTSKLVATYSGAAGTRNFRFGSTAGATEANVMNLSITAGTDILSVIGSFKTLDYTGFKGNGTLAGSIGIYANLTLDSGMTINASPNLYVFYATSGTQQITSNGVTINNGVTFGLGATSSATTYQIQGALTISTAYTATLNSGTISLGANTLSTGLFSSSNTNTRGIAFGTGQILVTAGNTGAFIVNLADMTNFTISGAPNVVCNYSGSLLTRQFRLGSSGGATEPNIINLTINAGTDILNIVGNVKNLDFTGFSGSITPSNIGVYGNLTLSSGMTINSNTAGFLFYASSGVQQITTVGKTLDLPITFGLGALSTATTYRLLDNLTMGATRLCTLNSGTLDLSSGNRTLSTGLFASTNSNTRVIAFGTGNITTTGSGTVWNTATPTNFSYTGTPTINISNNSATATTVSTGAMTAGQALNFNYTIGTYTLTDTAAVYKTLNFTGFAGTIPNSVRTIYGNVTFVSGMTLTAGANATTFAATSGIQLLTTNGKTLDFPITQNNPGATLQLQDNLTMGATRTYTFTAGDLHINNQTLSVGLFNSSNSNIRVIDFKSGNITTTGSGTVWTTATTTNFSYLGTPTVNISNNSATDTTVSTGSMIAAQALNFNYTIGTYTLTDTAAVYKTVNFTGFSGTIPNSTRTIYGGLTFSAGMTLTAGANATTFAATSGTNNITTSAKTLDFPITFNGIGGTWAFQDALTQGSTRAFTITNGTVQLKSSATSTTGAFATSGTSQKFLQSTTPGTQATLTQASGTVDASYLTIKDNNATGGATWSAPISQFNVDAGNNDGWDFFVQLGQYMYTRRKNKRLLINY